jgi:hypothetical protein
MGTLGGEIGSVQPVPFAAPADASLQAVTAPPHPLAATEKQGISIDMPSDQIAQ